MPKYADWLAKGMEQRGHNVDVWTPKPVFFNVPAPSSFKKWLGYIDQYILFPIKVKAKLKSLSSDSLFVFSDHALGPWVPLVKNRNHIIHCHDLLAQQSAMGEIAENKTGWTGRIYQRFIRRGYASGRNFISISYKTQADLHQFLGRTPDISKIVYNGLTQEFRPETNIKSIRAELTKLTSIDLTNGYILHVGGNQWYKNRRGVVEIYNSWRKSTSLRTPLLLVGASPNETLSKVIGSSAYQSDIHTLVNKNDEFVKKAYCGASLFLFPSLAEGFGWPIAESMASGCPVITTSLAPMTEVAGNASVNIPRRPTEDSLISDWSSNASAVLEEIINYSTEDREKMILNGLENIKRFNSDKALDEIELVYKMIVKTN